MLEDFSMLFFFFNYLFIWSWVHLEWDAMNMNEYLIDTELLEILCSLLKLLYKAVVESSDIFLVLSNYQKNI